MTLSSGKVLRLMAAEGVAGLLLHFHTTKNDQGRHGTAPGLDVTITEQGYHERDAVAAAIHDILLRRAETGADTAFRRQVDIFTSPGRSYDSGRILAQALGGFGIRATVAADPLLSGYDLGPFAGKTLDEMRALDPIVARSVEAYKQGFAGRLAIGQTSEKHYQQVQRGLENHLVTSPDVGLTLLIGTSSTVGVIDDWVRRSTVLALTGILPPPEYRMADLKRGEVRLFRTVIDGSWGVPRAELTDGSEASLGGQTHG